MSKPTRPLLKRQGALVLHLHEGKGAKLAGVAIGNAPWIAGLATAPTWRQKALASFLSDGCNPAASFQIKNTESPQKKRKSREG